MRCRSCKYIFLIIQFIMYVTFLSLDILDTNIALSNNIKFAAVILCFLYVIFRKERQNTKDHIWLCCALAFTVVSDIFILLTDYYFYGVLTFIIAQQLYGIRIDELYEREKNSSVSRIKSVIIRLLYQTALGFSVYIMLLLTDVNCDALLTVSIFYFISICFNVVRSLKLSVHYRERKDIRIFAYGMLLFLLCDINVGLFNISDFLPVGSAYTMIYNISSILMWFFYAPSQVLIALSGDTL